MVNITKIIQPVYMIKQQPGLVTGMMMHPTRDDHEGAATVPHGLTRAPLREEANAPMDTATGIFAIQGTG